VAVAALAGPLGWAGPHAVALPDGLRDGAELARLPMPALPWPAPFAPTAESGVGGAGGLVLHGQTARYALVLAATVALYIAMARRAATPRGRALAALGDDPRRAAALGLSAFGLRLQTLALSAGVAALAGALAAIWTGAATPAAALDLPVLAGLLLAVLLGGAGTLHGPALVGAALALAGPGLRALPDGWVARLPAAALDAPWAAPVAVGAALVVAALALPRPRRRPPPGMADG